MVTRTISIHLSLQVKRLEAALAAAGTEGTTASSVSANRLRSQDRARNRDVDSKAESDLVRRRHPSGESDV